MASLRWVYNVAWPGTVEPVHELQSPEAMLSILTSFAALVLASIAAPLVCSAAVPSPSTLHSDISLLYNNDLDRTSIVESIHDIQLLTQRLRLSVTTAPAHRSALLISTPQFHWDAASAC